MQLLDALLALGGDPRNTVPLSGITVAEAQLLRAIHGPEAVHDVNPLEGKAKDEDGRLVKPQAEINRLMQKYPAKDEDGRQIAQVVFAGGPMSVPQNVTDLDLPETCFRVVSRVTAKPVDEDEDDEIDEDGDEAEAVPAPRKTRAKRAAKPADSVLD